MPTTTGPQVDIPPSSTITINTLQQEATTYAVSPPPDHTTCNHIKIIRDPQQARHRNPQTEPSIEQSKAKGLWFVSVKLHSIHNRPIQAMVDTGCTLTCIRETTWQAIDKTKADYNTEYTPSRGKVVGANDVDCGYHA